MVIKTSYWHNKLDTLINEIGLKTQTSFHTPMGTDFTRREKIGKGEIMASLTVSTTIQKTQLLRSRTSA